MAYGLHYVDTLAGRVFSQVGSALGLAIPIYTGTAIAGGSMPLFNPPGSNRNVELIGADFNTASGTAVYGSIALMALPLTAVATGQLCTAFAQTTPVNGLLGAGGSKCLSSNAGTVTVTAGTAGSPSATAPGMVRGVAQINGEGAAAGLHTANVAHFDFQGTVIVPQGWMVYFACTLASVALITTTLVWKEIPINPAAG